MNDNMSNPATKTTRKGTILVAIITNQNGMFTNFSYSVQRANGGNKLPTLIDEAGRFATASAATQAALLAYPKAIVR